MYSVRFQDRLLVCWGLAIMSTGGLCPPAAAQKGGKAAGPLRVHPDNPRYFADPAGRAVYLTGSHTWSNVVDMGAGDPPPPFDFDRYLDFLEGHGHNYTRLWTWEQVQWDTRDNKENRLHRVGPHPYARTGPGLAFDGKPRFNLSRINPEYLHRLRDRAVKAGRRGIYVSVMLFEGFGVQFSPDGWRSHPYHPDNNINSVNGDANGDGSGVEVHELEVPAVTRLQELYVHAVIEKLNDLENVLYEISNENHARSTQWQYHMIRFIQEQEKRLPLRHPVGMTFQYKGGRNRTLFESPADWISPNPEDGYRDDPPRSDGRKVILNDTDHLWGIGGNPQWVWKSFLRGLNPIFMDPYDGEVLGRNDRARWDPIRRSLGHTRRYAERVNLAAMTPLNELASSGYCLASPQARRPEYLVYAPGGGRVSVDLRATSGRLAVEWFNPDTAETHVGDSVQGGTKQELQAPFSGEAVLYLASDAP